MTIDPMPPELALDDEPFDPSALDEPENERVQAWRITDEGAAEWAMRRLAEIEAEHASLAKRAQSWTKRIREWFEQRCRPLEYRAEFFRGHLRAYALDRREAGEGATLVLPSGRVSTLPGRMRAAVTDGSAFLAWAAAHPDHPAVKVSYDLAKVDAVKSFVAHGETVVDEATGEVVPGLVLIPGEPTAKVTITSVAL